MRRKQSVPTGRTDTRQVPFPVPELTCLSFLMLEFFVSREPARSAEEFFIDVILQRHARNLLCARRLADLGRMAARLDFQLVAWLARERDRAARLDDPVAALQQLHEDFHWPHPAVSFPFIKYLDRKVSCEYRVSLTGPPKGTVVMTLFCVTGTLTEEGIQSLSMDIHRGGPSSRVGDSGYMSQSGLHGSKLHEEFIDYSGLHNVQEAHLLPHNLGGTTNFGIPSPTLAPSSGSSPYLRPSPCRRTVSLGCCR